MAQDATIRTWRKRLKAAEDLKSSWETDFRTQDCYDYWRGDQLKDPVETDGTRKAQVNKIHAEVRTNIPSMYFYRPYARINPEPEEVDTVGSRVEERSRLLQDTVNYLIRHKDTGFRENTYLSLLESEWAFGCVEVGYSAEFVDAPGAERPELKEKKDTKVNKNPPREEERIDQLVNNDMASIQRELERMRKSIKSEKFYVRHIPANRILVSISDKPCVQDNDWIGYWEDLAVEDVKKSRAYKNTRGLKSCLPGDRRREKTRMEAEKELGEAEKVRLYKIWNLRTKERFVIAEGHDKYLLRKRFKRFPLKFLRFDPDPYHFYPIPPIYNKLGPQDEYNRSREFLRITREGRKPKFTFDAGSITPEEMKKLEGGKHGLYAQRQPGTTNPIEPVPQPNLSDSAVTTLTFSDKEFSDVGGIGGDARVSQEATATQAKIAAVKEQSADSYDRGIVADWLGDISLELLQLAIENMNIPRVIAINTAPDGSMPEEAMMIAQDFQQIDAQKLSDESNGLSFACVIDIESLSPVSEEEAWQKWIMGLQMIGNPGMAMLFAVSPELLKKTLEKMGIRSARDQQLIIESMQKFMQMQMSMAQMGQQSGPGVSPMGGGTQPGQPQPDAGGPQPGGPVGPGASQ
jgi:hypothetical protein